MEVDRFKHRQLAPTVGPSSRSSGEFEGPTIKINLLGVVCLLFKINQPIRANLQSS
jgi:hypothetical protein